MITLKTVFHFTFKRENKRNLKRGFVASHALQSNGKFLQYTKLESFIKNHKTKIICK